MNEVAGAALELQALRRFADELPLIAVAKDARDLRILVWNTWAERITGVSREEILGRTADARFAPQEIAPFAEADRAAIARDAAVVQDVSLSTLEGVRLLRIRRFPLHDAAGAVVAVFGLAEDVTELRAAIDALRRSEDRFRAIARGDLLGILESDASGRCVWANERWSRLTGRRPEEAHADGWLRCVHPDDREAVERRWRRAIAEATEHEEEFRYLRGDEIVWVRAMALPMRADDGRVVGYLRTSVDVTARKKAEEELARREAEDRARLEELVRARTVELERANRELRAEIERRIEAEAALRSSEEQLRHAQKMEAIGRLAGGVAHDFNNLLSVILTYADLIGGELPEGDPLRDDVAQVQAAGERAAALTRQLLAFSRQQPVEPRTFEIDAQIGHVEQMVRRLVGEDVEVRLALAAEGANVHADPNAVEQVLLNLVVNARDAMPDGGRITIATSTVEIDERQAEASPGRYVVLSVEDTGHGMDDETKARIFEPFFTTKPKGKGTGLGLPTVYGIARQFGGFVRVESERGKGARFRVHLPLHEGATPQPKRDSDPVDAHGDETILLVEDDDAVRAAANEILARAGYTVLEAKTPAEALALCERHPGSIHLLLTDVVMPMMSGFEVAARVTAARSETRVVYMSGYTEATVTDRAAAAAARYLQKPFTPKMLSRVVREVLDE